VECTDRLLDVSAHGLPRVALCEDVFRQALGAVSAVFLLRYLKDQFVHANYSTELGLCCKWVSLPVALAQQETANRGGQWKDSSEGATPGPPANQRSVETMDKMKSGMKRSEPPNNTTTDRGSGSKQANPGPARLACPAEGLAKGETACPP